MAGSNIGQFINKAALNVDRATNASAIVQIGISISAIVGGMAQHLNPWVYAPSAMMGLLSAFGQWLQGAPSSDTKLITKVLGLEGGRTNAELVGLAFRRIVSAGLVPGVDGNPAAPRDYVGRSGTSERRGNALNGNRAMDSVGYVPDSLDHRGSGRMDVLGSSQITGESLNEQDRLGNEHPFFDYGRGGSGDPAGASVAPGDDLRAIDAVQAAEQLRDRLGMPAKSVSPRVLKNWTEFNATAKPAAPIAPSAIPFPEQDDDLVASESLSPWRS
jgi:hypothetical protein